MKRVVLGVMIAFWLAVGGGCRCCHFSPRNCAPCGVGMGCGEWYLGDWHECCEPCDCHGNWIGGCHDYCGGCDVASGEHYFGGSYFEGAGYEGAGPAVGQYQVMDCPYYDAIPASSYRGVSRHSTRHVRTPRHRVSVGSQASRTTLHRSPRTGSRWVR